MKAGDVVWSALHAVEVRLIREHRRYDGAVEWEVAIKRVAHPEYATLVAAEHLALTREEAMVISQRMARRDQAQEELDAATEAVASARDAVVEASRGLLVVCSTYSPRHVGKQKAVGGIIQATSALVAAERVEAEARAKLEALR